MSISQRAVSDNRLPKVVNERERFILEVLGLADERMLPVRDVVFALLTMWDIEQVARNSGEPVERLIRVRRHARDRLMTALRGPALAAPARLG